MPAKRATPIEILALGVIVVVALAVMWPCGREKPCPRNEHRVLATNSVKS